jgi:hypothetical protein
MYPLWIVCPVAMVAGCQTVRLLFGWQRRRYADRLLRQVPDAIELMISAVRSGLPVSEAFHIINKEMSEPTSTEFQVVVQELGLGRSADEAIRVISDRTGVAEYAILSVTQCVSESPWPDEPRRWPGRRRCLHGCSRASRSWLAASCISSGRTAWHCCSRTREDRSCLASGSSVYASVS